MRAFFVTGYRIVPESGEDDCVAVMKIAGVVSASDKERAIQIAKSGHLRKVTAEDVGESAFSQEFSSVSIVSSEAVFRGYHVELEDD